MKTRLSSPEGRWDLFVKRCPVCNGMVRNYQKFRVNMDTICENKPVDTSFRLFGRDLALPVFAAPIGVMQLHYEDKYDDLAYNEILVAACREAGIAAPIPYRKSTAQ